jgi:hypothetical protein
VPYEGYSCGLHLVRVIFLSTNRGAGDPSIEARNNSPRRAPVCCAACYVIVNVTEDQLKCAPKYRPGEVWDWTDTNRQRSVYDYYGIQPKRQASTGCRGTNCA